MNTWQAYHSFIHTFSAFCLQFFTLANLLRCFIPRWSMFPNWSDCCLWFHSLRGPYVPGTFRPFCLHFSTILTLSSLSAGSRRFYLCSVTTCRCGLQCHENWYFIQCNICVSRRGQRDPLLEFLCSMYVAEMLVSVPWTAGKLGTDITFYS